MTGVGSSRSRRVSATSHGCVIKMVRIVAKRGVSVAVQVRCDASELSESKAHGWRPTIRRADDDEVSCWRRGQVCGEVGCRRAAGESRSMRRGGPAAVDVVAPITLRSCRFVDRASRLVSARSRPEALHDTMCDRVAVHAIEGQRARSDRSGRSAPSR